MKSLDEIRGQVNVGMLTHSALKASSPLASLVPSELTMGSALDPLHVLTHHARAGAVNADNMEGTSESSDYDGHIESEERRVRFYSASKGYYAQQKK